MLKIVKNKLLEKKNNNNKKIEKFVLISQDANVVERERGKEREREGEGEREGKC